MCWYVLEFLQSQVTYKVQVMYCHRNILKAKELDEVLISFINMFKIQT